MITLNHNAERAIREHGEEAYPFECVGFLFGESTATGKKVNKALPVINAVKENKRRRFKVEAVDYLRAEAFALEQNLELLGVYHSHPDHPAFPSEHDLKQAMPNFSYFILSVRSGVAEQLTSWTLDKQIKFEEEKITAEINQK